MSSTIRDRFNRANGALGSTGDGRKCLVMVLSAGSHEQGVAAARGWTVTTINVTTGGVWPSRTAVAEYDLLVVDAGYNGIDGTSAVNTANAYADGVNVYSTGNDTTAMSPLFTGVASDDGTNATISPSGTHSLAAGWAAFGDGDLGLYLTGVDASAFTFATGVSGGVNRPLGVAMESPLTGARWVHLQPYSATHPADLDTAIYSWLSLNRWQPSLAWQVLGGTFAISGNQGTSSFGSIAVVTLGARSNGSCDMFVQLTPQHVYGIAAYARVVDASNYIRAVVRSWQDTYSYYNTEYQHTTYTTEYEYSYVEGIYHNYAEVTEYQYQYTTYSYSWSGWSTISTSGCRGSAPTPPSDTSTTQYRVVVGSGSGCLRDNTRYNTQSRSLIETSSTNYCWSSSGACNGGSATGNTRQTCGSYLGQYQDSGPRGSCDELVAVTNAYYWSSTGPNNYDDQLTGNSRQVATGTYWDTTYEAGVPTRQAGPYYSTTTYYGQVALEKRAGGVTTVLDTYDPDSTAQVTIRLEAEGSALRVYRNGVLCCTATDATHQTAGTKVGWGSGPSPYNATSPAVENFSAGGISPERHRTASGWGTMNRKIRTATGWMDFDTRVET